MKLTRLLLALTILALLASACQPANPAPPEVETAARTYLDALVAQDFQSAAGMLSLYSLDFMRASVVDAALYYEQGQASGYSVLGYKLKEKRLLDETTALVRVRLQTRYGTKKDESTVWMALRHEDGAWKVNWRQLIDYYELNVEPQTVNGLTVQPTAVIRFTDATRIIFRMLNENPERVVWGQTGEPFARLRSGLKTVEGIGGQTDVAIADPILLTPGGFAGQVPVDFLGLFEETPSTCELLNWAWADRTSAADRAVRWSFSFILK